MSEAAQSEMKSPRSTKSPGRSSSQGVSNGASAKFIASGSHNGAMMMTGMSIHQQTDMMQARNELKMQTHQ